MIAHPKTLEKLRSLINEETSYRSGPILVAFFNQLGSNDTYQTGFPSRWVYTDQKLAAINGTPELDKCIKMLFDPRNFVGRFGELDKFISSFNEYLAFDGWQVIRKDKEITFAKAGKINFEENVEIKEDEFLKHEFKDVSLAKLNLPDTLINILNERLEEIKRCLAAKTSLSVIFLAGSSLEGILLGIALSKPKEFNTANSAPKDKTTGAAQPFHDWSLANFIDVAHELKLLKEDVKKISHALRDFRNYIHPYEQMSKQFSPDQHTAKISWQVLKAAISQLSE